MLDIYSKTILKFLVNECNEGSYKVIDAEDIVEIMPPKYKLNSQKVAEIIKHLENSGYISVKYSDDEQFCLSPRPFGRQIIESEENDKQKKKENMGILCYALIFGFAFFGALLGTILGNLF